MNGLLSNEEAECGLNPNSEDLDAEEDDGSTLMKRPIMKWDNQRSCSQIEKLNINLMWKEKAKRSYINIK